MAKEKIIQDLMVHFNEWPKDDSYRNRKGGIGEMTQNLYPYHKMFSPIQINGMTVKNRLVMAPMGNIDMAEETGRPNEMFLQYFFERAKGGTGLLTTGLIPVSHGIDATVTELGDLSYFPRIDRSRTVLPAWRDLAKGVHAFGAKIFIQLTAGLGRVGNPESLLTKYKFPSSASMNPNYYIPSIPSLRISDRKLNAIVKNTGQASANAKAMGIDGVYLHGHEGYLIEQMTNPAFNRRKLGKYRDWMRFGLDMVKEIRKRCGSKYPIMYRIDLSLAIEETYDDETLNSTHLKKFKNGRTIAMTLKYMEELVKAGVDIFDVDLGCYDNWWLPHPPSSMPAGCFLDVSKIVKEHFKEKNIKSNAGLPVPVVAVGKLGYPDIAEQALRDEDCDMIMLGRPLLADAHWPNKAFAGRVSDIRPCIGCQEACLNEFVEGGHPQCAVNPRTSFEYQFPAIPQKAKHRKRIAVIGAGPAGVLTACTAAERGHAVDLYEKTGDIGGRLVAGGSANIKFDVNNYRQYLERQVALFAEHDNCHFYSNHQVSTSELKAMNYDTIVIAIGTKDAIPPISGIETANTIQAVDLFVHPEKADGCDNIIVVGGGFVGCEIAHFLSYQYGKNVTVIEMMEYFMKGTCTANRGHLLHALKENNVTLMNMSKLTSLAGNKVHVSKNTDPKVPNPYNCWSPVLPDNIHNPFAPKIKDTWQDIVLEADMVVFATGGKSDDSLYFELLKENAAPELHNLGDSFAPGKIHEATLSAYRLGLHL